MTDNDIALVGRALAHPARIRIVRLLAAQTECRGSEVFSELPLAQSTVSEHLRVLREAGLVESHPMGTAMVYCLVGSVLLEFNASIEEISERIAACTAGQEEC